MPLIGWFSLQNHVAAYCFLDSSQGVLLAERATAFTLPGSEISSEDSPENALHKEFLDGTGLALNKVELRGVIEKIVDDNEKWLVFIFYASSFAGKPKQECKQGRLKWISKGRVLDLNFDEWEFAYMKQLIGGTKLFFATFWLAGNRLIESEVIPLY